MATLSVGGGQVDLTPPLTIPYLAYHPRQGYFKGVHDPLLGRALVFDDGNERAGIICCDMIGFANHILGPGRHFTDEFRARVQAKCGIAPDHMMLATTHAHSTPETLGITRILDAPAASYWLDTVLDQLASAVAMACEDLRPSTLKVGVGHCRGVGHNRRPAYTKLSLEEQVAQGRLDDELQLLLAIDDEGSPRHALINFQTHPVTVQVQSLVSADYPGYATAMLQRTLPGCKMAAFMQGAAGNINTRRDTTDFRDVALYGTMVAGEALKLAGRMLADDYPAMTDPTVAAANRRIVIPPRPLPDAADTKARWEAAKERSSSETNPDLKWKAGREAQIAFEAWDVVQRYSEPQEAEAQAIRIGDLAIASTPGEMFTEWGLKIKRESPAPHTFVSELSNGWIGYMLNEGGFSEAGYEAAPGTWTQTNEDGARMITEAAIDLVRGLWR